MGLTDNFFKKVENKTSIDKDTIVSLANKLQNGNMKDESTLKEVIATLSQMTGKKVTKEQEEKIIKTVMNDEVPTNLEKYYE
jgi:hypothetical protein